MNEAIFLGVSHQSYDSLRPLAYTILADIIHYSYNGRTNSMPNQNAAQNNPTQIPSVDNISKILYIYCRNMNDNTIPLSTQHVSIK